MPPPSKLPPDDELRKLRAQGLRYVDIAQMFHVTEDAVYKRLRKARLVEPTPQYRDLLPWRVRREHTFAFPAQMLREQGKRDRGQPILPEKQRMLNKWLEMIKSLNVVVCYDPDHPPNIASKVGGFYFAERLPSDGRSLIRVEKDAELR